MSDVFARGLCSSPLVAIAGSQEMIGGIQVPLDCVAFVTVCSIVVNGCLLKAGVPIDSKFGGILANEPPHPPPLYRSDSL